MLKKTGFKWSSIGQAGTGIELGHSLAPFSMEDSYKYLREVSQIKGVIIPHQIHSNHVRHIQHDGVFGSEELNCDALWIQQKGIFLTIRTADCLPVQIYSQKEALIGIAHAGWKGLKGRIMTLLVQEMVAGSNSLMSDLCAFIGPGLRKCCFEVGEEFNQYFDSKTLINQKLDSIQLVKNQLVEAGLMDQNITDSGLCSFCMPVGLYSHRRGAKAFERNISYIVASDI